MLSGVDTPRAQGCWATSGLIARLVPSVWTSDLASHTILATRCRKSGLQHLPCSVQILHVVPVELPGPVVRRLAAALM
jgi:hypothetical protein